jgi:hypothetical protein
VQFPSRLYAYVMLALALAGGFIVVATFAFGQSTANGIGLDIAAVAAVAACFIHVLRGAGLLTCLIGAWTYLVTVGVLSGDTQHWVTFASAAAIVAISIAAQVVNVHASEPGASVRVRVRTSRKPGDRLSPSARPPLPPF